MIYDAKQIANWFIRRSAADNRALSIMTLLKLVYVSHGWHLEIFKKPLFLNRIEAWKFGPVIPDVYNAFRGQGVNVRHEIPLLGITLETQDANLLEEIYGIYGHMNAFKLSEITHEVDGPWDRATKLRGHFAQISDDVILEHYQGKRAKANAAKVS